MPNDRQRRYSEDEVSAILRLAMDKGDHEVQHDGMSLDELVEVATEAGIEPDLIRSAAERLDTQDAHSRGINIVGARPYTEIVRVIDGELDSEDWDEVVAELRSAFKGPTGEASQLGKSSEWYTGSEFTATHMSFTPEGGRTKMKARLTAWAVPLFGYGLVTFITGAVMAAVLKKSDMVSSLGGPLSFVAWLAIWLGAMGFVRWAVGSWYRKKTQQMKDALDRAQAIVSRQQMRQAQTSSVQQEEELREQLGSAD